MAAPYLSSDSECKSAMLAGMRVAEFAKEPCNVARPVALLGDAWTLLVLRQAFMGTRRFDDFQAALNVSRALLSDRLRKLVDAGILRREPYRDAVRTREQYRLTEKGLDLYPVLMALRQWYDRHEAEGEPIALYRHRGCGGLTEVLHRCSDCGEELTAREVSPEPGPGMAAALRAAPAPFA
jgi:DNA-binding HxlR family transcriptional regulator